MTTHNQPGDVRVNRANLLRRIGRVCFESGGKPGLPAPNAVRFYDDRIDLTFDTAEQASAWAGRYGLMVHENTYKPDWNDSPIRSLTCWGDWEGSKLTVNGWSSVAESPDDESAPEDTDPDDLSEPQSIEDVTPPAPVLDRHIALANSGDDRDGYTPPGGDVPADVEGIPAGRRKAYAAVELDPEIQASREVRSA